MNKFEILGRLTDILNEIEIRNDHDSRDLGDDFRSGKVEGREEAWVLISKLQDDLFSDLNE